MTFSNSFVNGFESYHILSVWMSVFETSIIFGLCASWTTSLTSNFWDCCWRAFSKISTFSTLLLHRVWNLFSQQSFHLHFYRLVSELSFYNSAKIYKRFYKAKHLDKYFKIFFYARTTHWYYTFKQTRNTQSLWLWFPITFNGNIVKKVYGFISNYIINGFVFNLYVIMTSLK